MQKRGSLMTLRRIERVEWRGFCDHASKELAGKRAEIEVASPLIGVQLEARWLPVLGLAYDPGDDVIEILMVGLDHLVFHPREFYVDYGPRGLESLGIVDHESVWQIVLLRDPLMLPAPHRV
jgi:hypothetical protein